MTQALLARDPGAAPLRWVLVACIAGVVAWRWLIAGLLPVTQDEAYYFDWARHLAWGYFDHPPGVALLGLGVRLEPAAVQWARAGGILAGALTLLVLARLYRNVGLTRVGDQLLALTLVSTTLPGLAGGVLTTPDTALALAWAVALHEAERALTRDRRRWVTAGLAAGLGMLGKYSMVLIGPVLLLAILSRDWRALRSPWPYLGALTALLGFAPNLLWNAANDWLSLGFQLGHGLSAEIGTAATSGIAQEGPEGLGERALSLFGYLAAQVALWGALAVPLVFAPWLAPGAGSRRAAGSLVRSAATPPAGERFAAAGASGPAAPERSGLTREARALLWAAALVPLGLFGVVATFSEVEPNWPAVYLMAAAPLAVGWLRRVRIWVYAAAGVNLLLVSLYAWHAATTSLPLPDSQNRILRETHGFAELAELAAGLDGPVFADRYQTTAMLRFYRPDLDVGQWPGLTRDSEYVRGLIAPRPDPAGPPGPWWLIARAATPPAIAGFVMTEQRRLFDCVGQPLLAAKTPPCERPLHQWSLSRYVPEG